MLFLVFHSYSLTLLFEHFSMSLSQSSSDPKVTFAMATSASTIIPQSSYSVDEEKPLNNIQKSRFDKIVIRFSSWKILFQIIFMIPSAVVPIYFGTNYINDCPIQPLISVFMIVTGCSNLVNAILFIIAFITANYIKRSSSPSPYARHLLIGSLIGQLVLLLFSVAWLVAGQIWIFGVQLKGFQSTDPTQPATYCHPAMFWNGFATIFITYAIWLILILAIARRFIIKRCDAKRKTASAHDEF